MKSIFSKLVFVSVMSGLLGCTIADKTENFNRFRFVRNHIYLPVSFGGANYSFLLDTGASGCSVNKNISNKSKFKVVGAAKYAGAQRVWFKADVVEIKDFKKYPISSLIRVAPLIYPPI